MTPERLTDVEDPRLAPYRVVRDPELVRRSDRFLAEGRQVVRILLGTPGWAVESVALTPTAHAVLREDLARRADVPCYLLAPAVLREVGGRAFHQGCLAVGRRPAPEPLRAFLDRLGPVSRLVVVEALGNPDNVGAIFRSAAALGAGGVVLSPTCCSPLYRKALRTSMGAVLTLPFVHLDAWGPAELAALATAGFERVALTPSVEAETLAEAGRGPLGARLALLFGTEGAGLSEAALAAADRRLRIPMAGGMDSLNVAAAAAVALHALRPPTGNG